MTKNVLTIDVEEYFHAHVLETCFPRSGWASNESRVVESTRKILDLLNQHGVTATFFVLGWVADHHPYLVREIMADGHEIATHGYWHELVYMQVQQEFERDLVNSLNAINRALSPLLGHSEQYKVKGYRAPSFSITKESLWALDTLMEHGIEYDSSIFPLVAHDRYGISEARRFASLQANGLWEFPVSTVRFFGKNWPVAGGGYFRLFPLRVTKMAIRRINREGHPAIVYLHPWEFDPEQPRPSSLSSASRLRHYVNIRRTEARLTDLLSHFPFGSISSVFSEQLNS